MTATKDKFRNANGTLTMYSFACGYLEVYQNDPEGERLRIYREPNDWHVKGFVDGNHVWEIFETLTEARKFSRKHFKLVKN